MSVCFALIVWENYAVKSQWKKSVHMTRKTRKTRKEDLNSDPLLQKSIYHSVT